MRRFQSRIKGLNEQVFALYDSLSQMKDNNEFYQESLIKENSQMSRMKQEKDVLSEKVISLQRELYQSKNNEFVI